MSNPYHLSSIKTSKSKNRIAFVSLGSRGDMEPFLTLAELVRSEYPEVEVICALPEKYRYLAEDASLPYFSLGNRYIDELFSPVGKRIVGASQFIKILPDFLTFYRKSTAAMEEVFSRQAELYSTFRPDRVVFQFLTIYPYYLEYIRPGTSILFNAFPYLIHTADECPPVGMRLNAGKWMNRFWYGLSRAILSLYIKLLVRRYEKYLPKSDRGNEGDKGDGGDDSNYKVGKKFSFKSSHHLLTHTPMVYGTSRVLFQKPNHWNKGGNRVEVIGFHERSKFNRFTPSKELVRFLACHQHRKILLISFGSMITPQAEERTQVLLRVCEELSIPAIFSTGEGGLVEPVIKAGNANTDKQNYNTELFVFVSQVPYDWLLKKPGMYGMIHHGGAGTTHMSLKYGCVTLVVPHILDQFNWAQLVYTKGVGPAPLLGKDFRYKTLYKRIKDLCHNPSYQVRAQEVAKAMQRESEDRVLKKEVAEILLGNSTMD